MSTVVKSKTGTRLDRAYGCMLGLVVGSSLGALAETMLPHKLATFDWTRPTRLQRRRFGNPAGRLSAGSEMGLALAHTLVREGTYTASVGLEAYLAWFQAGRSVHITTKMALDAACRGETPEERLSLAQNWSSKGSQSNASLIRVAPLGIFGSGDPARAAGWAADDSKLTHPNAVCRASCAALVAAIAHGIAGEGAEAMLRVADAVAASMEQDVVLHALQKSKSHRPRDYVHLDTWVITAIQNAFYQLMNAKTVEAGIVDTLRQGGNASVNASVVGALLGAVHGSSSMPARWKWMGRRLLPDMRLRPLSRQLLRFGKQVTRKPRRRRESVPETPLPILEPAKWQWEDVEDEKPRCSEW